MTRIQAPPEAVRVEARRAGGRQLAAIVFFSLALCSVANYCLAHWLGLSRSAPWKREAVYRRIGPELGPQVFCAGSSLLAWGLSWPEVSESLGQGIENWTVAGSSPEIWEVFQQQIRNVNTTIIGLSPYDLNEMRLAPDRARDVPLTQTISDLWTSGADPALRDRILNQYAMMYVRLLYPIAGEADKVLVGLRRKVAEQLGLQAKLEEHEGVVVEQEGVLNATDSTMTLADWSSARVLRRTAALQDENHGIHQFANGPKSRALHRILLRARQQGRVIIVVLPVPQAYSEALLDKAALAQFERELRNAVATVPEATVVRLDQVPGISDNRYFLDLVHLNSAGRRVLTPIFLKQINQSALKRNSQASALVSPISKLVSLPTR